LLIERIYLATSTAAVEPASADTATEAATTNRSAGNPAAVSVTAAVATAIAVTTPIAISGAAVPSAAIPTATVKAGPIPTASVVAAIPGAGSDEYTTREPAGTVVSVRRASIRIVAIVAVCTGWRGSDVSWANSYSNPNGNPCMGKS
jgi:hypothetical protein